MPQKKLFQNRQNAKSGHQYVISASYKNVILNLMTAKIYAWIGPQCGTGMQKYTMMWHALST
jgi:hypothetical protein